jgi:5-methylcytosine-specific restriction endonuclease McrA
MRFCSNYHQPWPVQKLVKERIRKGQTCLSLSPLGKKYLLWLFQSKTCFVCENYLEPCEITLEHVTPRSKGGSNEWGNLAVSHLQCNLGKRDRIVDKLPPSKVKKGFRKFKHDLRNWIKSKYRLIDNEQGIYC